MMIRIPCGEHIKLDDSTGPSAFEKFARWVP